MSYLVDSITSVSMLTPAAVPGRLMDTATAVHDHSKSGNSVFSRLIDNGISRVDKELIQADFQVKQYASGEPLSLHQVMITLEEARLQFQLLMQVRNRLLESYQDVMRMQV